jgi:alpha-1,2-mannosyltransferase
MLREASWLNRRRLRDYSTMLIAAYAVVAFWALTGHGIHDPAGRPIGTDFLSFWTVSSALQHDQTSAIYAPERLAELEHAADPGANELFYAWAYPPIALLLVYPLALLPYLWSLALWLALGVGLYLAVLWRIMPRPLTLWAGLAFPAVFVTVSHGQNGLLSAGLLGSALLLLPARPWSAGVLIGLLSFKPQLGLLIPFALAAGAQWRTMAAAALTVLGLSAASLALFGSTLWSDFLASLPFARAMLELELVPYYKLQSVFAATRLLGGSVALAYALQGLVAVGAASLVVWVWRQPAAQDLKNAALMTASLLATPFVLDYDMALLAPPAAWLVSRISRGEALPWEKLILAVVCLAPVASRGLGYATHILLAPVAEAALLLTIVARIRGPGLVGRAGELPSYAGAANRPVP